MKISIVLTVAVRILSSNAAYTVDASLVTAIRHLINVDGGVARKTQTYRDIIIGLENMGYHPEGSCGTYDKMHKMRQHNIVFLTLAKELALEQGL